MPTRNLPSIWYRELLKLFGFFCIIVSTNIFDRKCKGNGDRPGSTYALETIAGKYSTEIELRKG